MLMYAQFHDDCRNATPPKTILLQLLPEQGNEMKHMEAFMFSLCPDVRCQHRHSFRFARILNVFDEIYGR